MTLEGANNFSDNNNSTIYTVNSTQTGQYCVVIPKDMGDKINMLVDLNMKNSFDGVINNTSSKDSLVKEIEEEYANILGNYPCGVLVLPMLDVDELNNSIVSNDKQKMLAETKKIGNITSELYQKLSNAGVDKSKIDQKIVIVKKTDVDNKFVDWLKEQMPNFVDGVSYEELKNKISNDNVGLENINPFMGDASNNVEAAPVNDIFGAQVESSNDSAEVQQPTEPEAVKEENGDNASVETDSENNTEVVEPQPVTDTKLETTQVVPNVSDNVQETPTVNTDTETPEVNELDKKSGGFANLLILLVILIGVTVASIELGKFLYNSFGA